MTKIEELSKFYDEAGGFFLSTVDGDIPRCRPLGLQRLYEGEIYYGIGNFKKVYQQMQVNPRVEIVALKGMTWARVNGTAVFDSDDIPILEEIMKTFPLKKLYAENGWKLKLFHLVDVDVQYIDVMTVKESFHI